jgi:ecotin
MKTAWLTAGLSVLFAVPPGQGPDNMKAFPPADQGMVRYVLQLPKQDDESAFKVELIVGKTVQVDERNRYFFGGKIEEETTKGWGFPRYNVAKLGPMAGTLIGVDPNAPKVARFIALGGDPISSATTAACPLWSIFLKVLKCAIGYGGLSPKPKPWKRDEGVDAGAGLNTFEVALAFVPEGLST